MMRVLSPVALAVLAAFLAAGCACDLEDAAGMATAARSRQEAGMGAEAVAGYLEAGACIEGEADDDAQARYLLAAICFRIHLAGGPAALPAGESSGWLRARLGGSGEKDLLALAFRDVLTLERETFSAEGIPAWATVDRLLIAADIVQERSSELLSHIFPGVLAGIPPGFAEAFLRMGALEVVRGFSVQAWRRALDGGASPDASLERLASAYRGMAEACGVLAASPIVAARGREWLRAERDRCAGLAERVRLVISPDDLRDPVTREMLKLDLTTHLDEGRRFALDAFAEKQSGNRARAVAFLRQSCAHFALAFAIGIEEDLGRRGAGGMLGELLPKFAELMSEAE